MPEVRGTHPGRVEVIMRMTRREFGFAILAGMALVLLRRIVGRISGAVAGTGGGMRARFWSRADRLAG